MSTIREQIADHVARYYVTTPEAVKFALMPDVSIPDIRGELDSLAAEGALVSARLFAGSALCYSLPVFHTTASKDVLRKAFAVLSFCCLQGKHRKRITDDEFHTTFPELARAGLPMKSYYVSTRNEGDLDHLGYYYIDLGRDQRRIVRKCHQLVERRLAISAFRDMIEHNRFRISVLTGQIGTADYLTDILRERPALCPVEVAYISELGFPRGLDIS